MIATRIFVLSAIGQKLANLPMRAGRHLGFWALGPKLWVGSIWECFHSISHGRKPYDSHQNFCSKCHRKKVRWTISHAWPKLAAILDFGIFKCLLRQNRGDIHSYFILICFRMPNQPSDLCHQKLVTDFQYFPLLIWCRY